MCAGAWNSIEGHLNGRTATIVMRTNGSCSEVKLEGYFRTEEYGPVFKIKISYNGLRYEDIIINGSFE